MTEKREIQQLEFVLPVNQTQELKALEASQIDTVPQMSAQTRQPTLPPLTVNASNALVDKSQVLQIAEVTKPNV